ncbi:hypothetical protein ZYGR_0AK03430 [Zygosaccharomyces rouxii]|uniref:PI31 proteasome regulator C-terminal domain-containing protein n=1 Tax=Zygosaccharomyces rouxii TaxID=4956 RepID=A0A1Q3ADU7_ZYGRO|nr:hypothetical protein ZYGR_0AK03430 [Zygosaccharomyces rouxii]
MTANSRLALSVQLVAIYLRNLGVGSKVTNCHEESNLVKASLADDQNKVLINIIGVGIEPSRAMLSLYQNEKSLGQAILDYGKDLLMDDVSFPVDVEEFLQSGRAQVLVTLDSKYKLSPPSRQVPLQEISPQGSSEPSESIPVGLKEPPPSVRGSRPPDMPDFEDEYQVRQGPGFSRPQQPLPGYGDSDLYPMGRSNPLMGDPLMATPPGGMIFDPAQDAARRKEMDDIKNRGPGFMPGTKWDDPFGRPGFGGPGGFGPGGFI